MTNKPEGSPGLLAMERVFGVIILGCKILAGSALVLMTLLMGYQVFGRYVLNDTPTWVDPLSLLLVMVIAFLGAAVGVAENTHLAVSVFRSIVPPKVRLAMVIATDVIMAGFGGVMLWFGAKLTIFKWGTLIPLIQWTEGLRSLPLTISGALVLIFSLGHLTRLYLGRDERTDSIE